MKNIAIIPARGGSKRLPGKNILPLDGIPLIAHSILFAKKHPEIISAIYVSTDDPQIKEIAIQYGAEVIDRPEALAGDFEPTVSSLQHVLQSTGVVDHVILLQPTNPLRPENLLGEAFAAYLKNNSDSLFTVTRSHQKLGKISSQKFIPFNYAPGQRSQDLEPLFFENGLLYICRAKLIQDHVIISENAFPFEVNHAFAHVDIDTHDDFNYAEYLIQTLK